MIKLNKSVFVALAVLALSGTANLYSYQCIIWDPAGYYNDYWNTVLDFEGYIDGQYVTAELPVNKRYGSFDYDTIGTNVWIIDYEESLVVEFLVHPTYWDNYVDAYYFPIINPSFIYLPDIDLENDQIVQFSGRMKILNNFLTKNGYSVECFLKYNHLILSNFFVADSYKYVNINVNMFGPSLDIQDNILLTQRSLLDYGTLAQQINLDLEVYCPPTNLDWLLLSATELFVDATNKTLYWDTNKVVALSTNLMYSVNPGGNLVVFTNMPTTIVTYTNSGSGTSSGEIDWRKATNDVGFYSNYFLTNIGMATNLGVGQLDAINNISNQVKNMLYSDLFDSTNFLPGAGVIDTNILSVDIPILGTSKVLKLSLPVNSPHFLKLFGFLKAILRICVVVMYYSFVVFHLYKFIVDSFSMYIPKAPTLSVAGFDFGVVIGKVLFVGIMATFSIFLSSLSSVILPIDVTGLVSNFSSIVSNDSMWSVIWNVFSSIVPIYEIIYYACASLFFYITMCVCFLSYAAIMNAIFVG